MWKDLVSFLRTHFVVGLGVLFWVIVAYACTNRAHAATPEQMRAVLATLTEIQPEVGIRHRVISVDLHNVPVDVLLMRGPNIKRGGQEAFGIVIDPNSPCGLVLADFDLQGLVAEANLVCTTGVEDPAPQIFSLFGGPQALFDLIIAEALK